MTITVGCECGWLTDLEPLAESNPRTCPECGGEIFLNGFDELTDEPLYSETDDAPHQPPE
jgi:hypothetical protein